MVAPIVSDPAWDMYNQLSRILPDAEPTFWEDNSHILYEMSYWIRAGRSNPLTAFTEIFMRHMTPAQAQDLVRVLWTYVPNFMTFYQDPAVVVPWRQSWFSNNGTVPTEQWLLDFDPRVKPLFKVGFDIEQWVQEVVKQSQYKFVLALCSTQDGAEDAQRLLRTVVSHFKGPCLVIHAT